jgi:hypothetical protein
MTEYKITIEGFESGLTENAVKQMVEAQFPHTIVEVSEGAPAKTRPTRNAWTVYEKSGDGHESLLGEVEASSRDDALTAARRKYGAPISVKEDK